MEDECCVRTPSELSIGVGVDGGPAKSFARLSCRVLVVDDENGVASLVAETIQLLLQADTVQVSSAEEAIEGLQRGEFNLVVSDIRMPGIGGFGLLNWIQEHRPALRRRFLFVSGDPGGAAAEVALALAAVPVVEKPFSCAELAERCRKLLDREELCEIHAEGCSCYLVA